MKILLRNEYKLEIEFENETHNEFFKGYEMDRLEEIELIINTQKNRNETYRIIDLTEGEVIYEVLKKDFSIMVKGEIINL